MTQMDKYWAWMGNELERQREKMKKYCSNKRVTWDEDVFNETIVKMGEKIRDKGIEDCSPQGFDNYFFMSFKRNIVREQQYSRNSKRDDTKADAIATLYEDYFNHTNATPEEKIEQDLRKDFAILYLANKALEYFDSEIVHILLTKYYYSMTYKQLQKRYPNVKHLRDRVLEVKAWLCENVTREEVDEAFQAKYGDIITN